MSTERDAAPTRRERARRRRGRLFVGAFVATAAVLAALGLAGAAIGTALGPRTTDVAFDPEAAVSASGSRLVVTVNQAVEAVDADQVTVEPAAAFTVDTSGRSIGVRFTLPLRDDTDYTVRFADLEGKGGGPATTVTHEFRTPPLTTYLLQRGGNGDSVFRTDLSGENAVPVFQHEHIEDFRATARHLVMSVLDEDGHSRLIVTDLNGQGERELALPGEGTVSSLQTADRGELVGYTFTDADIGAGGTRESMLYIASVKDAQADDEPTQVVVEGAEPRVDDWRFVPDTDSLLLLTFDGRLLLTAADGSGAADLGTAFRIDGIARGSSVAVVQRYDAVVALDLTDGSEQPLPEAVGVEGTPGMVTPIPGSEAGSIRPFFVLGETALDDRTDIQRVAADGEARAVFTLPTGASLLQTCVSPSAQYVAVVVAPDAVDNSYDGYLMPMPETVHTHVLDLETGDEVQNLSGFDLSWCLVPPPVAQ